MDESRAQAAKTTLRPRHDAIGFWRNLGPSNSSFPRAGAWRPGPSQVRAGHERPESLASDHGRPYLPTARCRPQAAGLLHQQADVESGDSQHREGQCAGKI